MLPMEKTDPDRFITVRSGGRFYLADETCKNKSSILIEDIASALSKLCRFTGHTKKFYSVAEHAVMVSLVCGNRLALEGLHHDDHEAFTGDVSSPLRSQPFMEGFNALADSVQTRIRPVVGLPRSQKQDAKVAVKYADRMLLQFEADQLMHGFCSPTGRDDDPPQLGAGIAIRALPLWSPETAEKMFMLVHASLIGGSAHLGTSVYSRLQRDYVVSV